MTNNRGDRSTYAAPFIKGDWDKSRFVGDYHVDNLMTALVNLGGEHWALRRRMLVIERLLDERDLLRTADIEAYRPGPEETAAWTFKRDEFIESVFSPLTREVADVSQPINKDSTTLVPPR